MPNVFEACLRNVPTPTILLKRDLSIYYANATAERLIGHKCRDWKATGLHVSVEQFEQLVKAKTTDEALHEVVKAENHEYRLSLVDGDDGEPMFMVIVMHSELATDYRTLFDKMPMLVAQYTELDVFHNKAFLRFSGSQEREADYLSSIHPEDLPHFKKELDLDNIALADETTSAAHAHRLRGSDGAYRWVKASIFKLRKNRTVFSFDVHDLYVMASTAKDNAESLRLTELENQRLISCESTAKEGSRLKGEFLATTSHEIRTPIAGVIGMVDLLLDTELDREQRDYANSIRTSADALLTVINDVLDFSKIEAGKLQITKQPFEMTQMIKDVETMLSFMTSKKGLGLKVHIDPGPFYLWGDRGRVRQILTNLLSNAIKFTQHGSVALSVERMDGGSPTQIRIKFSVSDTGTGMTDKTIANLFRPFAQGDAGRKFGGTGLGLSICKQLTKLMDGEIGVESKINHGTTFWVILPFDKSSSKALMKQAAESSQASHRKTDSTRTSSNTDSSNGADPELYFNARLNELLNLDERQPASVATDSRRTSENDDGIYPPQIKHNESFDNPERPIMSQRPSFSHRSLSTMSSTTLKSTHQHGPDYQPGTETESSDSEVMMSPRTEALPDDDLTALPDMSLRAYSSFTNRHRDARKENRSDGASAGSSQTARRSEQNSSATTQNYKDKTILLAEDNEINCKIAMSLLRKLGYSCVTVMNGRAAVDAVDERASFDLVLMDCHMPLMDGYEATRLIRQSPNVHMRNIPVIALTASAVSGDREKCLAAGMDDYLTKPVNKKHLEKKLQKWLFN
ncbi:hypothetical protein BCR37DRAFT_408403 [Protomyces lactucae-debilis]|uniref:histidine kinase n=1 Tax=Protomyces lactucae-debilis TaxID=2754530 RepID=A0A1Y2FGF7_PROLT|nr:uncharacterized protein BCR37DRAFT_408403 [Protomyces lactucae-debilis]ORY83012.1 hypothetical protein BCR37DRAFT_408403 [Protomyces lactucae-debilis]